MSGLISGAVSVDVVITIMFNISADGREMKVRVLQSRRVGSRFIRRDWKRRPIYRRSHNNVWRHGGAKEEM